MYLVYFRLSTWEQRNKYRPLIIILKKNSFMNFWDLHFHLLQEIVFFSESSKLENLNHPSHECWIQDETLLYHQFVGFDTIHYNCSLSISCWDNYYLLDNRNHQSNSNYWHERYGRIDQLTANNSRLHHFWLRYFHVWFYCDHRNVLTVDEFLPNRKQIVKHWLKPERLSIHQWWTLRHDNQF